ncbi:LOW QUALITY PROTEIN: hypothetical protein HID58_072863 [Brassica napus]|uniref:Uncharacterized protein n=1 Tax=Brassica napus TaxID=3708 RepID=A0ABQ7Z5Q8_BRANA|nr:LOW QUALITY PROTEIN: hypothetical protein HID58_072863 [Brassica napus]
MKTVSEDDKISRHCNEVRRGCRIDKNRKMLSLGDDGWRYEEVAGVGLHVESSTVQPRTVQQQIRLWHCDSSRSFDVELLGSKLWARPKQIRTRTQSEALTRRRFEFWFVPVEGKLRWPVTGGAAVQGRGGGSRF